MGDQIDQGSQLTSRLTNLELKQLNVQHSPAQASVLSTQYSALAHGRPLEFALVMGVNLGSKMAFNDLLLL